MDLKNKKLFLLDMDGTIYLDDRLFPDVKEFLSEIKGRNGRYLFLSNNSSRGTGDYIRKMERLGIDCGPEDFLTSADVAIDVLKKEYPLKQVYVMGTASLRAHMSMEGIRICDNTEEAEVFLAAYDTELTYQKLKDACLLLNRKLPYLATNPDWVCPGENGPLPDCGSMCEMLWHATGRKPRILGKPEPEMVYSALKRTGFSRDECVLTGDRLYTDIACGVNAGIDTIFVLSGEGKREDIEAMSIYPSRVADDISMILKWMKEEQ